MSDEKFRLFKDLTFNQFKELAQDPSLSCYEKIGFPDSYRKGKEAIIFEDIVRKLRNLKRDNQVVVDIGPGCSELPLFLIELCRKHGHTLILIDSKEMLDLLPNGPFIKKIPAFYPNDCDQLFHAYAAKVNAVICYSVLHYIFLETSIFTFVDRSLDLLAEEGEMLIGDIPNISKRKRFFSSNNGTRHHQQFTKTTEVPDVSFNRTELGKIDDAVILSLILRSRSAGFDAYILPQNRDLPMANRREDILITKP